MIENPNPLYGEHLNEGVSPIMVGIYDRCPGFTSNDVGYERSDATTVDYYGNPDDLRRIGCRCPDKKERYVISPCDETNKQSSRYHDCSGIVVVGQSKETGREISILTHQDPTKILGDYKQLFENDLRAALREIVSKSIPGTLDIGIFGGLYELNIQTKHDTVCNEYCVKAVQFLSQIIFEELEFEPVIFTGPNIAEGATAVYFDCQNRRLYLEREPRGNDRTNAPYLASDIENQIPIWKGEAPLIRPVRFALNRRVFSAV
jgi:hypothetical protein